MAIHLFTTTDWRGSRRADFARLLASVERSRAAGVAIHHHLLLQNCPPATLAAERASLPAASHVSAIPGRASVSAARNRLMAAALVEVPFGADDVVAFPDDDCWYTDGFLARLEMAFAERPSLDLLVCRVALDPEDAPDRFADIAPASAAQIVRLTMSNSLFVRGSLATTLGGFDPTLGLGTPAHGGEDTDYAVRALLAGTMAGFLDRPLVGHPPADRSAAVRYYHGAAIVLARYARRRPVLMREYLRKLLVGLVFTALGRLPARTYVEALRNTLHALRLSPRRTAGAEPVLGLSRPL